SASAGLPTGSGSARETPAAVSLLALANDARTLSTYLFAATAQGLFRSDDLGGRWRAVAEAPEGTITALAGSSQGVAVATPWDGFAATNWPGFQLQNGDIDLSTVDTSVVPESWVVLQQSRTQPAPLPPLPPRVGIYAAQTVNTVGRSDFGLTAQVTRIGVQDDGQLGLFDLRLTDALVDSAALPLAAVPVVQPMSQTVVEVDLPSSEAPPAGARVAVAGKPIRARVDGGESVQVLAMPAGGAPGLWTVREASGAERPLSVVDAATVAWEPAQDDDPGTAEVVAASPGALPNGATTPNAVLAFTPALKTPFDPATVKIQANVAQATQGETVPREVLGSGDATKAFQRFTLTRKPLTYVPTALGGYRSTLQVRVGDVLWTEVQSFVEQQASSRVYTVLLDAAGQATVVFGDGVHGARLPTGVENVVATYRTGLWTSQVAAGSLSLLQQRPYGLRGAANPQATVPGVPPEGMDDVRARVPMSLRTLDRVVSLADYLDFARTYPGVGKAAVDPLWTGTVRLAAVTAAGLDGKPLSAALCARLAKALQAKAAPGQAAGVFPYRPAFFAVGASLILQADLPPDTTPDDVLDAARSALLDAFGAARRSFGQGVAASEVTTVLQKVEGVAAVDLRAFHRKGHHPSPQPAAFLASAPARWEWRRGQVALAKLLLIDPSSIDLQREGGA
ncbi:MAG TPA: baseplate J/gp47 family protein, partial [Solirubrobacterales bacterium]|nr:baseplate J/gp47 family protein [Solirubrobacterales bacterium]